MQLRDLTFKTSGTLHKTIHTTAGVLQLRNFCPPSLVESLRADDGLRAFARLPQREHHRLLELAKRPDAALTLAYTQTGVIVGEVSLAPADGWWQGLEQTYEIAVQVSSSWRNKGIARQLLASALSFDAQEKTVILAMGLSWHWDTTGLGLTPFRYQELIERLFASYGFCSSLTIEPNIVMDPANILLARIGNRVDHNAINQFLNCLLVGSSLTSQSSLL